jgi:hypothetical protein
VNRIVANPANGTVTVNANGTITYTPNAGFNGADTFQYEISDGNGGFDTATVRINVAGVNDLPDAVDDVATTAEDTAVTINVLGNDTDPDGDTLTVNRIVSNPSNGTVTVNANGTITYTPAANYNGPDSFQYEVTDGNGGFDIATVRINVTPVNDAPDARDDNAVTNEDTPITISVLNNDTDVDGDTLTVNRIVSGPVNGSVTVNANGTVTYTPNANFNGVDTFQYEITDGNGGFDIATVRVTVNPVNDAPDARDDAASTFEDTPVTINVLGNDVDVDGDVLSVVRIVSGPNNGSVTINANRTITYTPAPGYNGADTFQYEITDGNGGFDTATVRVNVSNVNDKPDAVDDHVTTAEDTAININVLSNDTDADGDALSITRIVSGPASGTLFVHPNGIITYTPNANFNGVDTFQYEITDGNGGFDTATVRINVTPVNDAPDARDDVATTAEDTAVTINVLNNDTDVDGDTLTVHRIVSGPAHGSVTVNANGTITYTPVNGYNGSDSFQYEVTDGNGGFDIATVRINVTGTNDAPDARDDFATTAEDTAVTINVLGNDTDPDGDSLSVNRIVSNPANGSVTVNQNGTITYIPNPNYNGPDSFQYEVSDGNGGFDIATVRINVTPVNDRPDARDDVATTAEDTAVTINVLNNDTDVDGDVLTVNRIVSNPAHGSVVVNANGTITYIPNPNYNGPDSFRYEVTDGNGGFDTATVRINVTPVNDRPGPRDDVATTAEDTSVTINVLANDGDPDGDTLTVTRIV